MNSHSTAAIRSPGSRSVDLRLGVFCWAMMACGSILAAVLAVRQTDPAMHSSLVAFWFGRETVVTLDAEASATAAGDPVFFHDPLTGWRQIGYVAGAERVSAGNAAVVTLHLHDTRIDPRALRFVEHRNRGTVTETVQVMFPPEKRDAIADLLGEAMQRHGETIFRRLVPLAEKSLRESLPLVEAEFIESLRLHREEVNELGVRWKEEVLKERLIPLAREHVLPIAQRHAEPALREIGRELWNRASLWSFTWRAAYDRSPLPRRDLMREEWERFIRDEAIPVIESHTDDLVTALERTIADAGRLPEVRQELAEASAALLSDPEAQQLVRSVLRETLVDNEALRQLWIEIWTGDEAVEVYEFAGELVGPLVHEIGVELFGSPERGIDPAFARVLRLHVLSKDRRWITAVPGTPGDASPRLERGVGVPVYPLLYLAAEQE